MSAGRGVGRESVEWNYTTPPLLTHFPFSSRSSSHQRRQGKEREKNHIIRKGGNKCRVAPGGEEK